MPAFDFHCVTGYFAAADPSYKHIETQPACFGLLKDGEDRWHHLKESMDRLRAEAVQEHPKAQVKLIYLGRHGQGQHNLKAAEVGNKAFLERWGRLKSDGQLQWGPDPTLTHLGEEQARHVNLLLEAERKAGMPMPTSFLASPLNRACRTHALSYGTVEGADKPLIMENLREGINFWQQREWGIGGLEGADPNLDCVFTDTERSPKTVIQQSFPSFRFEDGFSEGDPWWKPEFKETPEHFLERTRKVLEHVFANDSSDVVAITAHGGVCLAMQRLLKVPQQLPHTAAVLPFIIKAIPKN